MKKILLAWLTFVALLLGTHQAMGITMAAVGNLDELKASATLGNSGDATELGWVNTSLFPDPDDYYVIADYSRVNFADDTQSSFWTLIDGTTDSYAYKLTVEYPAHFLVKLGGGNGAILGDTHHLFENRFKNGYAVVDLSDLGITKIDNIETISHISSYGTAAVPEPATIFLFCAGLVGLAGARLRRKNV